MMYMRQPTDRFQPWPPNFSRVAHSVLPWGVNITQLNLLNWLKCFVLILLTAVVSTVLDQMLVAQSVYCNLRFAYLITFKAGKSKTKPISRRGERMLSVIRISVRISQCCQGSMENNILLLQWYQLITSLITPFTVSSCPWTCTRSSKHTININKIA